MGIEVTIGICVRNCQDTVIKALRSVFEQDYSKDRIEIIIVDDGSTDNTLRNVKAFTSKICTNIRIYSQNWKGIASARNTVIEKAKGKYIIWVDGDMRLTKNFVRKLVDFMNKHPQVAAAKGSYGLLKTNKIVALLENVRTLDLKSNKLKLWGTGGSIFRTDLLREIGGFDEKNRGAGEDIEVLIRILRRGWHICIVPTEFYENFKETWNDLWKQYFKWGRGARYVHKKYGYGISIFTHLPPSAFLIGVAKMLLIMKRDVNLTYLLLPIHSVFKEAAWCFGFILG